MTEYNIVKINPSESFNGTISQVKILLNDLDNKVFLHDKVYIYVQLCNGKIHRMKTNENFALLKHKFLKLQEKQKMKISIIKEL